MKTFMGLIKFILLLIVLALIFHNFVAKILFESALRLSLGVPVEIESAKVDFLNTDVQLHHIEIKNPKGFPKEKLLAYIPFLFVDFEISSLWEKKIHFERVELDFKELHVIRNPDGRLNLLALKVFSPSGKRPETHAPSSHESPHLQVDRLVLTLGLATFIDLSENEPPERKMDLAMDHATYRDLHSVGDVAEIVTWEAVKRMGLGSVLDRAIDRFAIPETKGFFRNAVEQLRRGNS